MNRRLKKIVLLLLAAALVFGAGRLQSSLNRDRDTLGLTRTAVLDNAPPALAFTTVALGGFRGLISNFLWIRANDLQQDDKFFEAAQLADWITKLEPTFTQVWLFQAWNMAYNISVKFKENKPADENGPADYTDRWHWVERGMELLRDDGLRYNPNSLLIYRELGWFFQHKIGQNLDDGNMFYKSQWAHRNEKFLRAERNEFRGAPASGNDQRFQAASNLHQPIQDGPRVRKIGGRTVGTVRLAAARGARDLLGPKSAGRRGEKSRQGEGRTTRSRFIGSFINPFSRRSNTGASSPIRSANPRRSARTWTSSRRSTRLTRIPGRWKPIPRRRTAS